MPVPLANSLIFDSPSMNIDAIAVLPLQVLKELNPNVKAACARLEALKRDKTELQCELKVAQQRKDAAQDELNKVYKILHETQADLLKLTKELHTLEKEVETLRRPPLPSSSLRTSPEGSLSPSDSISQCVNNNKIRSTISNHPTNSESYSCVPPERPKHFPPSILWTIEDCLDDPDAAPSKSNSTRPKMPSAIRTKDGRPVTNNKYRAIRSDVALLAGAHLYPLPLPANNAGKHVNQMGGNEDTKHRSYAWYKKFYPQVVANVIKELEKLHEELRYCACHWKAKHMIQQHLYAKQVVKAKEKTKGKRKGKGKEKEAGEELMSDSEEQPEDVDLRMNVSPSHPFAKLTMGAQGIGHSPASQLLKRPRSNTSGNEVTTTKRSRPEGSGSTEHPSQIPNTDSTQLPAQPTQPTTSKSATPALSNSSAPEPETTNCARTDLQTLRVGELKAWAQNSNIPLPTQTSKKADLVNIILASAHVPSKDEINTIVNRRIKQTKN